MEENLFELGELYTKDNIDKVRLSSNSREYSFGINDVTGIWFIRFLNYELLKGVGQNDWTCSRTPNGEMQEAPVGPAVIRPSKKMNPAYYQRTTSGSKDGFNPASGTGSVHGKKTL